MVQQQALQSEFTTSPVKEPAAKKVILEPTVTSLKVKKLSEDAKVPTKGSELAAGYDISSSEEFTLAPKSRHAFTTGLAFAIPVGHYGRVAPRSGLAVKNGIDVGAGVIDADYRGEVKVLLFNLGEEEYTVKKGDRIAQLIIERISTPEVVQVEDLDSTERGEGGFGSTGKN